MINIGDRVEKAINYIIGDNDLDRALEEACIAVDITSKKYLGKNKSSSVAYKNFLKDYTWLISFMGMPGIIAGSIRIGCNHPDIKSDKSGHCGIEDIIYHIIRCGLIHSGDIKKIEWSDKTILGTNEVNGNLILPKNIIYGLLGAVIFCPVNKNEKIKKSYSIFLDKSKFNINDVWGNIDLAKTTIYDLSGFKY